MKRLKHLADHRLTATIQEAKTDLQEIKNAQLFGSHSVKMHRVGGERRFTVGGIAYNNSVLEIVFTANNTDQGLGGVQNFSWTATTTDPSWASVGITLENVVPVGAVTKFRLYLQGSDSTPYTTVFKFWFWGNADGTYTVSLV